MRKWLARLHAKKQARKTRDTAASINVLQAVAIGVLDEHGLSSMLDVLEHDFFVSNAAYDNPGDKKVLRLTLKEGLSDFLAMINASDRPITMEVIGQQEHLGWRLWINLETAETIGYCNINKDGFSTPSAKALHLFFLNTPSLSRQNARDGNVSV